MSQSFIQGGMGGVVSVVEILLLGGLIAQDVAQAVIKAQIKKLMQGHEEEFRLMNQLYQFVDVLINQNNLTSQLNGNVLFATNNWNSIRINIQDKNDMLVNIMDQFPTVKASDFNFSFTNGLKIGGTMLLLGFQSYNFISKNKKIQLSRDLASFRDFFKNTSKIIRSLAPEIRSGRLTPEGIIEVAGHGTNAETAPPEIRESKSANAKAQAREQSSWRTKLAMGVRVIFIGVMIYGFINGVKNLQALKRELDLYRAYFSEEGEFQRSKAGIIELMSLVGVDIFNLANATQAAFVDSRNLLLTYSVTLSEHQEAALSFAKRLNPTNFGLTQDFIDKSRILLDDCNQVAKSGKSTAQQLKDLENHFRKFYDDKKPEQVFRKSAIQLSKVVGQYSLVQASINMNQDSINRMISQVALVFLLNRSMQNFESLPINTKRMVDKNIMKQTLRQYLLVFDLPETTIQQAGPAIQDRIFHLIISFTDTFYYDDDQGKTLLKKKIADFKGKVNYEEILKTEISKQNVVPVRKEKDADENKEINDWMTMAQEQNARVGYTFWPKGQVPKHRYRYIRLYLDQFTNVEGKLITILLSYEGIHMVHGLDLLMFERNVLTGEKTLTKA